MTSPPPPTWHTLTPSHSEAEAWVLSLYETMATHRSLMDAHTVDFFTCSHWDNIIPGRWKEDLKNSEFFTNDDDNDLIFPTTPSADPGSLRHYLYTVRSHSIPMVWGGVPVPDHHLARFGMTTKKSHEVDNLSRYVSQLTSKLNITQVLDVGSGKGYLSQHLALSHRLCVVGIDAQISNTQGAITRNEKVYKAWRCVSNPHKLRHNPQQERQPSTSYRGDILAADSSDNKLSLSSLFNEEELPANYEKTNERGEKKMYDCGKTEQCFASFEDEKNAEEVVDKSDEQKLTSRSSSERREDVFSHDDQEGLPESNSVSEMKNVSLNSANPQKKTHGRFSEEAQYKFDQNSRVLVAQTDGVSFTPLTQTISLANIGEDETLVSSQTHGQGSIMESAERESGGKFICQGPTCLVGLHTCGDLGGVALRLFLRQPQLRAVCVVSCCYHHITEEEKMAGGCCNDAGFPMSKVLQSRGAYIGRTGRMLACQAASRISLVSSGAALESVFRRAVLQVLLKRRYPDVFAARGKTLVVGRMRKPPPSFQEYVRQSLKKLDLDTTRVPGEEVVAVYREYESERQHLSVLLKLRAVLASCVESLVLMDRLVFLHEQESMGDISLVQLFDPALSPRCFAVAATKL